MQHRRRMQVFLSFTSASLVSFQTEVEVSAIGENDSWEGFRFLKEESHMMLHLDEKQLVRVFDVVVWG